MEKFQRLVKEENLESALVAVVTEEERLVINIKWNTCRYFKRFLDTNGVRQIQDVKVVSTEIENPFLENKVTDIKEKVEKVLQDMNVASQRGMVEMFDASIGRSTVLMPYGGKYQLTESEGSVQSFQQINLQILVQ